MHVHAWQRAFDDEGMVVPSWQIHRCIGMDGSRLVGKLSDDAPDDVQERLSDKHSEYYREITPLLQPLPGARDLLHRVAESGLQVVLASSAPEDDLDLLRKVLDCDDVISETTSSRYVDTAKPEPGIGEWPCTAPAWTSSMPCSSGTRYGTHTPPPGRTSVHLIAERRHRPCGAAGSGCRPCLRRSARPARTPGIIRLDKALVPGRYSTGSPVIRRASAGSGQHPPEEREQR